ncbi:50S ribosomal protein P1 [Candidatus Woesearchaeota archaeon]|jgi:large subunit ribosomal protein L12|nr:50S ribosomal protein P1 [Candidatus Woesearchaeota archaeon]|tara:strand:+ start:95 stop:403 length:309 start_codon:yes stop_codon:yes gene_type:complete
MEYVYAAMLLHKAGKKVDNDSMKKVLTATGVKADEARIKALVASLENVDIDEAIKSASAAPVVAPVQEAKGESSEEKKEEKPKEDDSKNEEQAAAGLGALFG